MKVNRRYVWAGAALAGVLLIFFWWWSRVDLGPELKTENPHLGDSQFVPDASHPPHRRQPYLDDCDSCPPVPATEGDKRNRVENRFQDCHDLLVGAAAAGDPDPDTSFLGGCHGLSPLHLAENVEEVQALLAAGADPNLQDSRGQTPLHLQVMKAISLPSEKGIMVVRELLAAEADPWIRTNSGQLPYDLAQKMNTSGAIYELAREHMDTRFKERGSSWEEEMRTRPQFRERVAVLEQESSLSARVLAELMKGMYPQYEGKF